MRSLSVLQCVAGCCSVLPCVAVCCRVLQRVLQTLMRSLPSFPPSPLARSLLNSLSLALYPQELGIQHGLSAGTSSHVSHEAQV